MTGFAFEPESGPDAWDAVPEHLREGLSAHIAVGQPTGDFLTAALSNDLLGAVTRADTDSARGLRALMRFLFCETPAGCWGSAEKVAAWRARGGQAGIPQGESAPMPAPGP